MSGLEVAGLVLAGVSAAAGVKSASGRRNKNEIMVYESRDCAYAKGKGCEAWANGNGAYACSSDGTAMAAWSGKYSSSRR
ncbi:hypothetical protein ABVK25_011239 [Lepraria finkii]|uniref:Uncharacterized protein n=1 Tax=Lepraria finkii TaxID=1340010 RepID=A0ABR4AQB6_9LECA